jgi:hypothetical protein
MIAMQYQLQTFTGHIEIPGYPGVELDDQVGVIDEGTGANTRIWAADVQSTVPERRAGAVDDDRGRLDDRHAGLVRARAGLLRGGGGA